MAISNFLSKLLGLGGSSVQFQEYRCEDCDATFESAKRPERAQCRECLSTDVELLGAVDG